MIFNTPQRRRWPIVNVNGIRYLVDIPRRQLRCVDDQNYFIRFERSDPFGE